MLLSQIVEEVLIFEDKIEISLKITMKDFLKYAQEMSIKEEKTKTLVNDSKNGYS